MVPILINKGVFEPSYNYLTGFPGATTGKEPSCQCRRCKPCGLDLWVGKITWRRARQPTPVFSPGESPWTEEPGGLQSTGSQRVQHDWVTKPSATQLCSLKFPRESDCANIKVLSGPSCFSGTSMTESVFFSSPDFRKCLHFLAHGLPPSSSKIAIYHLSDIFSFIRYQIFLWS